VDMDYQRGFLTLRRAILAQPFKGHVQIARVSVNDPLHGTTMPQAHFLNPDHYHSGATQTLVDC